MDDLRKEKWALFGTGKLMPYYRSILLAAGENISRYVDNDQRKWDSDIEGIPVVSPQELVKRSYNIVISCSREKEIRDQLCSMGIGQEHIFNSVKLFHHYVKKLDLKYDCSCGNTRSMQGRHTVLFDAYDGIGWGGTEMWSYRIAEGLQKKGHKVVVYGAKEQMKQPRWEPFICRFPYDHKSVDCWWEEVENIAKSMEKRVPFTLINNWSAQVLGAAIVVKRRYPDLVRIVTVVHNDVDFLYRRIEEFADEMDEILCVSRHIMHRLREKYRLDEAKLHTRMNFIHLPENKDRNIRQEGEPLRIGWGGRLEIIQKRADMISKLITRLDAEGVFYRMEIAGNGDYSKELEKWIEENGKGDHVRILGFIQPEKMYEFWSRQHIYINISDYEGSSLAMLEAMACGAVPVVTEVSGVPEAVVHGENGFTVPLESIEGIARGIGLLDKDENLRRRFSGECQRIVSEKCCFEDYVDYIENLVFAGSCNG